MIRHVLTVISISMGTGYLWKEVVIFRSAVCASLLFRGVPTGAVSNDSVCMYTWFHFFIILPILVIRGAGVFPGNEGVSRVHQESVQDCGILLRSSHIWDLDDAFGHESQDRHVQVP